MPIFAIAGAGIASAIGLGATAASVISAGLAVAANVAVSYFTRQKETPATAQKRVAIAQQEQFGADVPRFTIYGTAATSGHRHFYAKWGDGDLFNGFVHKLADGWCDGLEPEVYFYGEKHSLVSATPIGIETERWTVSGYEDLIEFRFYDGRPGQTADAKLVADTAGAERRWLSTDTMTNQAYVISQTKYDKDKFSRGRPQFMWVLRGLRAYDWRKDSTVSGGLGTHRLDDLSTWEHTTNPPVLRANFQMGLKGLVSGRTLIGQGKAFAQLHLSSYTAAANVADTDRTKNGRTFKTYQIGLYVDAQMDHTEVLGDFDDAVAGYAFNASGLSGIIVGAPQISSFTISETDVRKDGARSGKGRRDTDDLYNHLTGTFTSPDAHWSPEPLTPVTVAADVTADKRKRSQGWDFTHIPDADVAQYLLNIRYRQGRLGAQESLPVMPKLYRTAEAGDWCTWLGKTWLVMGKDSKGESGPTLSLAETSALVYDETDIAIGPIVVAPTTPAASLAPVVADFAIAADVISGETDIPALRASWTPSEDPRIDATIIEYRIQGETDAQRVRDDSPADGVFLVSGLAAGAPYEARAAYVTTPALTSNFTPWLQITTSNPPLVIPPESVILSSLSASVDGILANVNRLQGDFEQILAATAAGNSAEQLQRYTEDGEIRAIISTSGQESKALVAQETTARTSAIEALAAQTLLVQAALGEASATGLMKVESSVSGDGLTTSFSFFARATTSDEFEEAGMIIEVVSDGGTPATLSSRVAFVADKFVFDDGTSPFSIADGNVFINSLFFRRLRSDPSISTHSIDIDGDTGRIRVTTTPPAP